jgi:4-hydroxy-2-oxoheptanedioate aldolase
MQMPLNTFKHALARDVVQIGLWVGLADAYVTELLANTGFDWLMIDAEHAPNDVRSVLAQLQAAAPYPVHAVVRPVQGDVALIKQYLDIGAQTLLIPMVDTAVQARAMVAATRYPPHGVRGVGSALARSSRWNQVEGYLHHAHQELCVLVQIETTQAMSNLAEIARVDGVDGVFFGPSDLCASMGHLGNPGAPAVQEAIEAGIAEVRSAGKVAGILAPDRVLAERYLAWGARFVAVGVDTTLLTRAAMALAASYRAASDRPATRASGGGY